MPGQEVQCLPVLLHREFESGSLDRGETFLSVGAVYGGFTAWGRSVRSKGARVDLGRRRALGWAGTVRPFVILCVCHPLCISPDVLSMSVVVILIFISRRVPGRFEKNDDGAPAG